MEIVNKLAIVTGASEGLGAALAEVLVARGATVYGLARNEEKLSALRNRLGEKFILVRMDITNQRALDAWVKNTFSDELVPDILINNAGTGYLGIEIDQLGNERWQSMINTNLNGMFYMTASIVPMMKQADKTYHIINIGSILGKMTRAKTATYSATKYAVQGFSEALYKELSQHKIKVTCVNPGSMSTHIFDDSGMPSHPSYLEPKDAAELIVKIIETPDNFLVDEITFRPLIEHPSG